MKKRFVTAAVSLGVVGLIAGCGTTSASNNSSNASNATNTTTGASTSAVTADMKAQFVAVTASAQQAMDDFMTGTSMLGTMDTKTISGTKYNVVATSKADLNSLETTYLDFLTKAQVDNLFGHVTLMKGDYVFQGMSSSGDNNDWTNATVKSAVQKGNGYDVTLSVPQTGGGDAQTQHAELVKNSSGHWVYAGQ